jgi:response regulator RpfG family c-di-GMP phosphodiesterase
MGGGPSGACLLDVGDTLDVMTSDQAYRRTLTYSAGREGIQWQSGRRFDPAAAIAFPLIPEAA